MLKMLVATVRDDVTQQYANPQCWLSSAQAVRSFGDAVANPQAGDLYNHPEHFQLFAIGEFDVETGRLVPFDAPRHLASAVDLKPEVK